MKIPRTVIVKCPTCETEIDAKVSLMLPELIHCKDCKYFGYKDWWADGNFPVLIADHCPTCTKWGTGSKTDPDGFCYLAERKE